VYDKNNDCMYNMHVCVRSNSFRREKKLPPSVYGHDDTSSRCRTFFRKNTGFQKCHVRFRSSAKNEKRALLYRSYISIVVVRAYVSCILKFQPTLAPAAPLNQHIDDDLPTHTHTLKTIIIPNLKS